MGAAGRWSARSLEPA